MRKRIQRKTPPRFSKDRDYDNPLYKKWRKDVARRDKFRCQWPGCGSNKLLRFHHIRTWTQYPALRFDITNGITLCKKHHDSIWGEEESFEMFFYTILKNKYCNKQRINREIQNIRAELRVCQKKT